MPKDNKLDIQKIYANLNKLSHKEKMLLYLGVAFAIFAILDRIVISPVYLKLKSLDEEIHQKELGIQKNMHILLQKDRIATESVKYAPFLNNLRPEDDIDIILQKEIEAMARKSEVDIIDLKPTGLKESESGKKFTINMDCEAKMEQLAQFMYEIENSSKLLKIEKFQITPKSKESSTVKCVIMVSKIVA